MQYHPADEEQADELGPGSDLVLSLLAMCLLLLALMGIGFRQEMGKSSQAEDQKKALATLRTELNAARQTIATQNGKISELEAKDFGKRYIVAMKTIEDQKAMIANLTQRAERAEAQLDASSSSGGRVVEISDSSDVALFSRGDNTLTDEGAAILWRKGIELGRELGPRANLLVIEGHASPDGFPRPGRNINKIGVRSDDDGNLDLSAARAAEVAHYFRHLGIPYQCMEIRGYGSARSNLTAEQRARLATRIGQQELQDQLAADRRIKITGVRDSQSKCEALSTYFRAWPRRPPELPQVAGGFPPSCPYGYDMKLNCRPSGFGSPTCRVACERTP